MNKKDWRIYLGKIPYDKKGNFWVSFESDPGLKKTKDNIYGRCLPCIENLYQQLKDGCHEIVLGTAFNCWKITAIVIGFEECISLLNEFEKRFPLGHVYGKLGSGRPDSKTRVVVFHAENSKERDRLQTALKICLPEVNRDGEVIISRACGILYDDILGDWRQWKPIAPIKYPRNVRELLKRIKEMLYRSTM